MRSIKDQSWPREAVPFYGIPRVAQDYTHLQAHVLGHYAEDDAWLARADIDDLHRQIETESGRPAQFHFYPAGHAFLNDENLLGTTGSIGAPVAGSLLVWVLQGARLGRRVQVAGCWLRSSGWSGWVSPVTMSRLPSGR
jgi:Dienelactone hydrolase family